MPKKGDKKERRRLVVEEVSPEVEPTEEVSTDTASVTAPVEEVKEKVEQLQSLTEGISESAEKSAEVQEELVEAVQKVEPAVQQAVTQSASDVAKEGEPYTKTKGPNPLVILIPGVILLGALLGGFVFYQKGVNLNPQATPTSVPLETPAAISTPTPTPLSKADLTKYGVNVENGSGIPGTAGSAKDILTKAGFKVNATGNADNFNYTDTIIETKSDVPSAFVAQLTSALSGTYKVGTPTSLPASSTDEVVVIIGTSKAQ